MKTWENIRNYWLAAALVSSSLVLLKLIVSPPEKPPQPTYKFPEAVPLSRWEFVKANSIAVQKLYTPSLATAVDDLTISGKQYRYLRNGRPLEIEMRYFISTYTDVADILKDSTIVHKNINFKTDSSPTGSRAVYQLGQRLYFSACIPPTHRTTVQDSEFRGAQTQLVPLAERFFPWFVGQIPLRDIRCLWTRISLSIDSTSPDTTRQELEQTWTEWVQWWQQNYPAEPRR